MDLYDWDGKTVDQNGQIPSSTGAKVSTKVVNMKTETVFTFNDSDYTYKDSIAGISYNRSMTGLQGSCSDGTYVYAIKTDGSDTNSRVVKIDPKTWKVVQIGPIVALGHANDLTYNSKTGYLYVADMTGNGKSSVIDRDTLDIKEAITVAGKYAFFGIAYDSVNNRYVLAKSAQSKYSFALATFNGTLTSRASEQETYKFGYTAQGIFCDQTYIYYTQSGATRNGYTVPGNIIAVYNWDYELVCVLKIDNSHEIESMFWYDGAFYACFQSSTDYIAKLVVA